MLHITSAQVISGHTLSPELTGAIFAELRDPKKFKEAYLDPELRTVCWPNGADFAPEFLRSLVSEKQCV
jgi:hypothetical protein